MSTATKLYDKNGFTHDEGHVLEDIRHQFDSDTFSVVERIV